ncbi:hypothetical protein WIW50_05680 [Flavobacteriaceae bacterium 3-367]|uniref:hypothetical protein n=1 Tax=Eudoraea algarum TaxID=3417568 RepID=UPI003286A77B
MNLPILYLRLVKFPHVAICMFLCFALSCSNSDMEDPNDVQDSQEDPTNDGNGSGGNEESEPNTCTDPGSFIFGEKDGLVSVEFENADFPGDWELKTEEDGFSGEGYMVWSGTQYLGQPGNGLAQFRIQIENPGTYQFLWKSAVTIGNSGSDHNDTWLRFGDADDFFAQNGNSIVYPKGSGKTPHPAGATSDGWFKIYRSGNDLGFKWQARTFDNNAHNIFVTFDAPGIYTMEISARSSGHAVDTFVLFKEPIEQSAAISESNQPSAITCDN